MKRAFVAEEGDGIALVRSPIPIFSTDSWAYPY